MSVPSETMLPLTAKQIEGLISDIKSEVVRALITGKSTLLPCVPEFDLYQSTQVAGMLNMNVRTLAALPIPRYPLPGGKIVFYRLSEVDAYFQSIREK